MKPVDVFPGAELAALLMRAKAAPFNAFRLNAKTPLSFPAWQALPLLTKEDLRRAYPLGLLATPMRAIATYHESSGTAGEATASAFTEADWDDIAERFLRNAVNLGPDDTVLVKTPYALVTTAHQMQIAARRVGATVIPADNRSSNMPYAKVIRLLRDLPVTVAWCMPTEALIWARAAQLKGLDPARDFPHLRAFVVAGEALPRARKRLISSIWGDKAVFEDYGSTETGSLAGDCAEGFLHFWADRIFAEVRPVGKNTGKDNKYGKHTMRTGRGELVVSPLLRQGMPLVRYAMGDEVSLGDPCRCSSALPRLTVHGRVASRMRVGGQVIYPVAVEEVIVSTAAHFGVLFFRARVRGKALEVELAVSPGASRGVEDEVAHALFTQHGIVAHARCVDESTLLPAAILTDPGSFRKPRYVFAANEDWQQALLY